MPCLHVMARDPGAPVAQSFHYEAAEEMVAYSPENFVELIAGIIIDHCNTVRPLMKIWYGHESERADDWVPPVETDDLFVRIIEAVDRLLDLPQDVL